MAAAGVAAGRQEGVVENPTGGGRGYQAVGSMLVGRVGYPRLSIREVLFFLFGVSCAFRKKWVTLHKALMEGIVSRDVVLKEKEVTPHKPKLRRQTWQLHLRQLLHLVFHLVQYQ